MAITIATCVEQQWLMSISWQRAPGMASTMATCVEYKLADVDFVATGAGHGVNDGNLRGVQIG